MMNGNSGVHGRGLRRMMRFPRRRIIQRLIRLEEQYLQEEQESDDDENDDNVSAFSHPLGLVGPESKGPGSELERPILAQSMAVRTLLAKWLPITLRLNNLHMLYSTNYHGRTLERFYAHVKSSKHTVLICEVLNKTTDQQQPTILGMYASQAWRPSPHVYGDGGVFLFRLQPNPTCWKWHPIRPAGVSSNSRTNLLEHVDLDDDSTSEKNNQTALLEQFMVGTTHFISMGGNPDGSSGLRINEDLTKGESSTASGFDNEPLHGTNKGSVFDIGLLEVYGFVRQIDGKAL
jgi:TLD